MKPSLKRIASTLRGSLRIRKDEPAPPMPASLTEHLRRHFAEKKQP